jgi:hypothetical protein
MNPTFWDHFVGSLLLIRFQRAFIAFHLVFPSFGLFLLMSPLLGHRLGLSEIVLAIVCFSFTPLIMATAIWAGRRRNKALLGPITYVFDSEGMHTRGLAFTQTIQWFGILRVRRLKQFLFVFIAPAQAHVIPLRHLSHPDDLDSLMELVAEHTSCG